MSTAADQERSHHRRVTYENDRERLLKWLADHDGEALANDADDALGWKRGHSVMLANRYRMHLDTWDEFHPKKKRIVYVCMHTDLFLHVLARTA